MWDAIVGGLQFIGGLFGFGGKIQDEKNTTPMLQQKEADLKITEQGKINAQDDKASATGDDADFSNGL